MSTQDNAAQSVFKTPGAQLTALLAVVYGMGVAFGPQLWDQEGFWDVWLMAGAAVVGLCFIATIVVPLVRGLR
ncbi:hypothetical protein [Ornithinicoccus hortensis]|uniref:Uncharacterized protein n=1 Tax=Ornithinicoccus hortensis TaxID=82346 RepID=A0A542YVF1_9MICO|nr:hypothetical protein [Ornithinicoccus hortensis]TQL52065.1 hypothetical protein FB467_3234 [Ornithinicoccus hortensis]